LIARDFGAPPEVAGEEVPWAGSASVAAEADTRLVGPGGRQ
jgi:hypothetical protein